ncbi:hypothetical protein D3C84_1008740 [compost metagenome]
MHQDVQPSQALFQLGHHLEDRRCVGQVNPHRLHLTAPSGQFVGHGLGALQAQVGDDHVGPAQGKRFDDGPANALGAARDQYGLAAEIQILRHRWPPSG